MLNKIFKKYVPLHWHGIAFDGVFILLNLTLFRFLGTFLEKVAGDSFQDDGTAFFAFGVIIIVVYLWRLVALYLKRLPLKLRATLDENYTTRDGLDTPAYVWILSIATSLVSGVVIFVAIFTLLKNFGFGDISEWSPICLIIVAVELWLIFRLFKKPTAKELKKLTHNKPLKKETVNAPIQLFADLGLFAYMFVWQTVYNHYISVVFTDNLFNSISVFIFGTILWLVVFLMLYLGPRSVFLFEDAKYKITWVTISLVFLSSYIPHLLF